MKKINLLKQLSIFFCLCMLLGCIYHPLPVMAEEQIIATSTLADAPSIKLDKTYSIAAHDNSNASSADILAWYSYNWNNFHYVKFKVPSKSTVTIHVEDTGNNNSWYDLKDANGNRVQNIEGYSEFYVGTQRAEQPIYDIKFELKAGTYYLGLQPHATDTICVSLDAKVVVAEKKITLDVGDSTLIDATIVKGSEEVDGAKFTYKSSKTTVAKVSSKGKIVAVGPGTCKIGVRSKNATDAQITVIVKPKKLSGLKVASKTKNSIQLQWTKQKNVDGYEVWMYDSDLEEYTKVKSTDGKASTALVKNLNKGTTYKFRIRAYVKNGSKKYYSEFGATYKASTKK